MNPAVRVEEPVRVVVLHGLPGCGKLSIARELSSRTGWALFHNHLTVDLLLSLFPFGSPEFRIHRERLWLELVPEAVRAGRTVVFTFTPETTVSEAFPRRFSDAVEMAGGRIDWIGVHCEREVLLDRIATPERSRHGKLTSSTFFLELEARGSFAGPAVPTGFQVDSTRSTPAENASAILGHLSSTGLPTAPR